MISSGFRLLRVLVRNLLVLPLIPLWFLGRFAGRPKAKWIVAEIRPRLVELPKPASRFLQFVPQLARRLPTSLDALRRLAAQAASDPRIEGVAFVVPTLEVGWAGAKALRDVFGVLRAAGKHVVVLLPEGGGNKELYVGTGADRLYLGPQATLMCLGLGAESRYLKPLLDKIGVELEPFAIGEYKTAVEPLVRDSMSEPQREQLSALLSSFDGELRASLRSRGLDDAQVAAVFEHGFVRGDAAVRLGIADGVGYRDELPNLLGTTKDGTVSGGRYLSFREASFFQRFRQKPYIAVVEIQGAIGTPRSADKVIASLREARSDKRAKGVILHVSSPGGSALTSDLIHREIVRLKEKKPVVTYMGDVAASGGYYVAAPTDAIIAQPVTITGSIGVISAGLHAGALLEKLGIRTEVVRLAPHADMFSPARRLDEAERAMLAREMREFYDSFVELVASGRGRPTAAIEEVARGRVWSGRDAFERGLVDQLGGMEVALADVRKRAGDLDLELRLVEARRLDLPPAEPPPQPVVLAGALVPELAALWPLLASEERVLLYAPDIPSIR